MINQSDVFVLYDDMQYTRRDWRNRNKIKTPQGALWLTIPVEVKGKYHQKINETRVSDDAWAKKHLKSIELNYKKAAYFDQWFPQIAEWYDEASRLEMLSDINRFFIERICQTFEITTKLVDSSEYTIEGTKTDALISILDQIEDTSSYISGPAAKDYLDHQPFQERNIEVEWMDYSKYQEYNQLHPPFEHGVSIFDYILNCGITSALSE